MTILILLFSLISSSTYAQDTGGTPLRPPADKVAPKKATSKPDPLIAEFLSAWSKTKSFEADFTQTTHYVAMDETEKAQGHVWINKPGRLRWDETNSSQKVSQILDGKKLSSITERVRKPGFRTIDVWEDGLSLLDKAAFSFLSERRPLVESYDVTLQKHDGKAAWLLLKPKGKATEPLVAEIIKSGYVLRALSTETPESRVQIEFSKVISNKDIPDEVFEWTEDKEKDRVHKH